MLTTSSEVLAELISIFARWDQTIDVWFSERRDGYLSAYAAARPPCVGCNPPFAVGYVDGEWFYYFEEEV